jgi:DNA modification methylase
MVARDYRRLMERTMAEMNSTGDNGFATSRDLTPTLVAVESLHSLGRETRSHPPAQLRKLARSLKEFGFVLPIIVDPHNRVVSGWGLVQAAQRIGIKAVPAVTLADLSETQLRSLRVSLDRLSEDSKWDVDALKLEFADLLLVDPEFDLTLTGFEMGEIDVLIRDSDIADEDAVPETDPDQPPVSQSGDLWILGRHRLLCADATEPASFDKLMAGQIAEMVFTDPPYNVPIAGHVSGSGRHGDFVMASGEMSDGEFANFLLTFLVLVAACCKDGAILFACMDWRHILHLQIAGRRAGLALENLCVWAKANGGLGGLYRSQYELVGVFKSGTAPHINNVVLGRYGRYRTNVWTYPGMNSFGAERDEALAMHPTVKPLAMVEDAIFDCSNRGGVVLDPFVGSGTTLLAAERTGRRAFGLEIDPRYVDVALRRFRKVTGIEPVHSDTGLTLAELERGGPQLPPPRS